jgi:hypothetical protein
MEAALDYWFESLRRRCVEAPLHCWIEAALPGGGGNDTVGLRRCRWVAAAPGGGSTAWRHSCIENCFDFFVKLQKKKIDPCPST